MSGPLFVPVFRLFNAAGTAPLAGGKIYTYVPGTNTPSPTYTDSTLSVQNANPVLLDATGTASIWGAALYKVVAQDASNVTQWTKDNVPIGLSSSGTTIQSEWVASGLGVTYVSATTFTVAGDQTTLLLPNRAVRATTTAGYSYGYIASSTFSAGKTTVVLTITSGTLDAGFSAFDLGLIASAGTKTSLPHDIGGTTFDRALSTTIAAGTMNNFTANNVVLTLPSPAVNGDWIEFMTIGAQTGCAFAPGAGQTLSGSAGNMSITLTPSGGKLRYYAAGTNWRLIHFFVAGA